MNKPLHTLTIGSNVTCPLQEVVTTQLERPGGIVPGLTTHEPFRFTVSGRKAKAALTRLLKSRKIVGFAVRLNRGRPDAAALKFKGYVVVVEYQGNTTQASIEPTQSYSHTLP